MNRSVLGAAAVTLFAALPLAAQTAPDGQTVTFIHAGTLLARPGEAPRGPSTIIIRGDRIDELRDGYAEAEAGARVVDLKDRFVMPGLVDMHVHLWASAAIRSPTG